MVSPLVNVKRLEFKLPTERDIQFRSAYYLVERHNHPSPYKGLVETFGEITRAAHCKCCDVTAYLAKPCWHIEALRMELEGW